jgi:hypothetical protein
MTTVSLIIWFSSNDPGDQEFFHDSRALTVSTQRLNSLRPYGFDVSLRRRHLDWVFSALGSIKVNGPSDSTGGLKLSGTVMPHTGFRNIFIYLLFSRHSRTYEVHFFNHMVGLSLPAAFLGNQYRCRITSFVSKANLISGLYHIFRN